MRPDDAARCGFCTDRFGQHYASFDGKSYGCSAPTSSRANAAICKCRGFMILWRPEMEQRAFPLPLNAEVVS